MPKLWPELECTSGRYNVARPRGAVSDAEITYVCIICIANTYGFHEFLRIFTLWYKIERRVGSRKNTFLRDPYISLCIRVKKELGWYLGPHMAPAAVLASAASHMYAW